MRDALPVLFERKTVHSFVHTHSHFAERNVQVHGAEADFLLHGPAEDLNVRVLKNKAHAPPQRVETLRFISDGVRFKINASRLRNKHAVCQKKECGFARTVFPENRHALPFSDRNSQPGQRGAPLLIGI